MRRKIEIKTKAFGDGVIVLYSKMSCELFRVHLKCKHSHSQNQQKIVQRKELHSLNTFYLQFNLLEEKKMCFLFCFNMPYQ